ncbi:MAG: AraC family transcriptional regulator [Rhodobacteraceae bacterium]|nr:AraC family transcriptional regulator [Paracoccaceae bacterium]
MDVLSDVLRAVRLTGAVFFDFRASEPLRAQTPSMALVGQRLVPGAGQVIPFHIMMRGRCWVEAIDAGVPPLEFHEGDIVVYPHGHGHIFVTNLGDRVAPDLDAYRRPSGQPLPIMVNLGDHGPPVLRFVCGYLACDTAPFNPLLDALPSQVVARRPPEGNHIEVDLIYAAVIESETHRPGGEAILARLSELLFVRAIRRFIETLPENSEGWLAGLRDPHIGRALQLIHGDPARNWTLEGLARECGMSRAVFAERFARMVGDTPMRYLARWRMQVASHLLFQPNIAVEAVAEQVGYRSEASFSRAFKNIVGTSPGSWRRSRPSGS